MIQGVSSQSVSQKVKDALSHLSDLHTLSGALVFLKEPLLELPNVDWKRLARLYLIYYATYFL